MNKIHLTLRACTGAALLCLGLAAAATSAAADSAPAYPQRLVRIMVGFQPGGGSDVLGRLLSVELAKRLGQSVIIDNRSGAGGTIALDLGAKSPPDGYTLVMVSGSQLTNAALFTKVNYDIETVFAPIGQLTSEPYILLAKPALAAHTMPELIALAKSRPKELTCGSSGTGSFAHLGIELLNTMGGIQLTHVPYKGSGQALIDLLGGQIDLTYASAISATPHIKSGAARALAVTTLNRSPLFPDIPTIAESGVPGYEVSSWYALVAPKGTPAAIVDRLHTEIAAILASPEAIATLAKNGAQPAVGAPAELQTKIHAEIARWRRVVSESGIKVD
jgi:tripartite-type tricarboxylate transporter receptor subunit TctC